MKNIFGSKKKIKGLNQKVSSAITALSTTILIGITVIGTLLYFRTMANNYKTEAYEIAEVAGREFTEDELKGYASLIDLQISGSVDQDTLEDIAESEYSYVSHQKVIDSLREGMSLNEIAIVYIRPQDFDDYDQDEVLQMELKPVHYIMDSFYDSEMQFKFGGSWGVKQRYAKRIQEALITGNDPSGYFISKGEYGFAFTAIHPIYVGENGTICSYIEVPMSTLITDLVSFVCSIVLLILIVTLVMTYKVIDKTIKSVVEPVELVSSEAMKFISDGLEQLESEDTKESGQHRELEVSQKLAEIKTGDEIQALSESVLKMEEDINKYIRDVTRITAEKERIGAELTVATQIQADMLPSIFPPFPDRREFNIYASMKPAKEVGGDFYDFYMLDADHLALTIADVSGKGVPAALFMVISKTLLKNSARQGMEPADILTSVNEQLVVNNNADMFVTVWLGIMQISTGHVIAANGGHEFPAIRGADGEFELFKDKHGMPLGIMSGVKYRQYEFDVEDNGTVFVYTDGVAEATSLDNELFGTDRMLAALNADPDAIPEDLIANVKKGIDEFVGEASQFDDITMLSVKRLR